MLLFWIKWCRTFHRWRYHIKARCFSIRFQEVAHFLENLTAGGIHKEIISCWNIFQDALRHIDFCHLIILDHLWFISITHRISQFHQYKVSEQNKRHLLKEWKINNLTHWFIYFLYNPWRHQITRLVVRSFTNGRISLMRLDKNELSMFLPQLA